MTEIRRTDEFDKWLKSLRDGQAQSRILARIARLSFGNPGDVKPVGEGVSEMRIPCDSGHRACHTQRDDQIVILLIGGDKSSQDRDIAKVKELAAGL